MIFFASDSKVIIHIFIIFRGEKLYVTKDNRESRQNNCRSVVCITVVVLFLSAAIALAALIGGEFLDDEYRSYCSSSLDITLCCCLLFNFESVIGGIAVKNCQNCCLGLSLMSRGIVKKTLGIVKLSLVILKILFRYCTNCG